MTVTVGRREHEARVEARDTASPPPLVHIWVYPGDRPPRPGDKSLCGEVKSRPYTGRFGLTDLSCVVCATLKKAKP